MPNANNFDIIRLFAAVLVIYGHAFPLTGVVPPVLLGNSVQAFGVKIFFVISGFLITASWNSDPNPIRFAIRRALRIIPGLTLVVFLAAFVLGPIFTTISLSEYFGNMRFAKYFLNILFYINYDLPGVFRSNIYPIAVNGSLWSLSVEVLMYLVLPLVLLFGVRIKNPKRTLVIFTFIMIIANLYIRVFQPNLRFVIYSMSLSSVLDVAPYFFIGSSYSFLSAQPKMNLQVAFLAFLISMICPLTAIWSEIVLYLVLPYAVLSFAYASPAAFAKVGRFGDFSYGLYLFGFPVQQMIVAILGHEMGPILNFAFSFIISLFLSVVSWHLVEKRAQSLKLRLGLSMERTA